METSVDSIGNCSLDMDTSRELNSSDWTTEVGSTVTLQGSNNQDHHHHQHLPSYLSLACTVNGYSTTTNYDSIRLSARSRDASPHRMIIDHQNEKHQLNFSVTNNNNNLLLSPPNLVPLPSSITPKIMHSSVAAAAAAEDGLIKTATQSSATKKMFSYNSYTTNNTVKIITNELTHLKLTTNAKDATDDVDRKITTNSRELFNSYTYHQNENAQTICNEKKSFIQQRVERLYGPGALAQGFFVTTKRQRNRNNSECTDADLVKTDEFHHSLNKTLPDKLSDEENIEPTSSTSSTNNLKQSSSISSSFPSVFRHLRPEFRAQLPCLASPKKVADTVLMQQKQKSVTVPKLLVKNDIQIINNGKVKENDDDDAVTSIIIGGFKQNGNKSVNVEDDEKDLKDGHYFLRILDEQTVRLLKLAEKIDDDLLNLPNLSEEIIGQLRSASGKARLLVSQKMQQFKGLCTNNINQGLGEAYPTTNEDLQGFWDMVMLQIDQVDKLFEEIDKLRMNNWILDEEEETKRTEIKTNGTAKSRKSNSKPKLSAAAEEARKQREEQRRKLIEERRKAMKTAQESKNNNHHHHHQPNIKIFVPESS